MGMSASQARLLSITGRLTDNELHSQLISNSKLRLATESTRASNEYINALNSQELMYVTYDDDGNKTKTPFTAATIYNYAPLKNQYMLVNSSDKVLVTHQDAVNFSTTDDLVDFLKCYNLVYDATEDVYKKSMEDYYKRKAELEAEYEAAMEQYNTDYEQYLIDQAAWEADPYVMTSDDSLYERFTKVVGDSRILTQYSNTPDSSQYCYYNGLSGDTGCYLHLLNHLLGYNGVSPSVNEYETSLGEDYKLKTNDHQGGMDRHLTSDDQKLFKELSEGIENEEKFKCDGADKFTPYYDNDDVNDKLEGNIIQQAIDEGRVPTNVEILMSDYVYDPNTNTCKGVKSLKQKLIDLYYIIQKNLVTNKQVMKDLLINFTEGDLKMTSKVLKPEPQPPIEPKPTTIDPPQKEAGYILLKDKDQSQWYVNLWYKMNNSIAANAVKEVDFENNLKWNDVPANIQREYQYEVGNCQKDKSGTYYEELESNLSTSEEWLQFALEHGIVTIEQAKFTDPTNDFDKVPEFEADGYTWTPIEYTNATDIVSVQNEKKIAVAEVKYQKAMNDIQAKDKKYDNDLKKLDTQHNALLTEYESVKEMLSKNVDRSFKAFS